MAKEQVVTRSVTMPVDVFNRLADYLQATKLKQYAVIGEAIEKFLDEKAKTANESAVKACS